jgi:ATP-dependent helicase/nuclease subunit B
MEIVLGLDAETYAWPLTTNGAAAQAGGMVTGQGGLLRVVETMLGLGAPAVPSVRRLALWRAKLTAADGPARFWHRSFATDPFATSRLLLGWRDSLVDAGWHATALDDPPSRLADLAAAEAVSPTLPPGQADRLRRALILLREDPPPEPAVRLIRLLDERRLLPPGLRALLDALEATGTRILEEPMPYVPAPGDLGAAQGMLRGLREAPVNGDGRFTLLEAETETAAADLVADRLLAEPRPADVVVLATRPTAALDAALRRRHLPQLGISAVSPLRGILQALPLGLATRWQPFDARRMLEFLQLPRCPVPREVRRALIDCLPETPGRGGTTWREAVAKGLRTREERIAAEEPDTARRDARRADAEDAVATWLGGNLADPNEGMPTADLLRLCTALARWAGGLVALGVPLAAELAGHAGALAEAARETGLERLPRIDLERMLDAVLAEGVHDPAPAEEAAPWGSAKAPGAVWGRPRTVVWWGFDAPPLPGPSPWQPEERAALAAAGCLPWDTTDALRAASAAWRRPILGTRETALLVAIRTADAAAHPLAHELSPLLGPNPALRPRAEALTAMERPELAGVFLSRVPAIPATLPTARSVRELATPIDVRRETDSATALEALLGCPFTWVMQHRARLREGRFAQIAEDSRLIGLLAHRLAQEILPPGAPPPPEVLARQAAARLPSLIEETAAPLLQTGAAAERARVQQAIPVAMEQIGMLLRQGGLEVVEAEATRSHPDLLGPGEALKGDIDLLLRDSKGRTALLDLKWSRALRSYQQRLREGRAVQLAAYAALVEAEERAAYVLLAVPAVVGGPGGISGFRPEADAPSLAATWQAVRDSRAKRRASLDTGRLHALGIYPGNKPPPDPDGASLPMEAPCRFCAHGRLCGKEAVV